MPDRGDRSCGLLDNPGVTLEVKDAAHATPTFISSSFDLVYFQIFKQTFKVCCGSRSGKDMASSLVRIATLLCATVLLEPGRCVPQRGLKCSEEDQRQIYPYCMFEIRSRTIWCDQSNYTEIPTVAQINAHLYDVDCTKAKALFVNDSCLKEIKTNDLELYREMRIFLAGQNYIFTLKNFTFHRNRRLTEIDVCDNEIEILEERSLAGLNYLRRICLSNNKIPRFHPHVLKDLHRLEHFAMENNLLEEIDDITFKSLKRLRTLDLKGNRIAKIAELAFVGNPELRKLHLDGNQLASVTAKTFQGLQRLEILTISHNQIKSWPEEYGVLLINVHTLHLGNNHLEEFLPSHVANASKLQNLLLSNNSLSTIHEDTFLSTPSLRHIDLSANHLEDIPEESFGSLCHLESLILTKNNLATPRAGWFRRLLDKPLGISHVAISENKWTCDCEARKFEKFHDGLKRRRDDGSRALVKKLEITCQEPKFASKRTLNKNLAAEIEFRLSCPTEEHNEAATTSVCENTQSFYREHLDDELRYVPYERRVAMPAGNMPGSVDQDIGSSGASVGQVVAVVCAVVFVIVAVSVALFLRRSRTRTKQ